MKTELETYADNYTAEILAYETLSTKEFMTHYIDSNHSGSEDNEMEIINEYFDCLEVVHYNNENASYFEICLGCGGPNIYLNINTRWESVEYIISWGGECYRKNISHLYTTIVEIYALDCY